MNEPTPLTLATPTLANYSLFVEKRRKKLGTLAEDLHHMGTGCASEAGELLGCTKAMWVYGQPLWHVNKEGQTHREHLIEEAGDMLFYLQGLANLLGLSLLDFIAENERKLLRRYPDGYSDAAAAERADKVQMSSPKESWQQLELDLFNRISGNDNNSQEKSK